MPNIMEHNRGERLILLYQYLPRGESKAKTLAELMTEFNPTGEKKSSRSKSLENDLADLYLLWGENSVMRSPDWLEGSVAGKTPKYYLHPDFSLDKLDVETLFFWEMLDKFTAHYLPKPLHNSLEQQLNSLRSSHQKLYQNSQLGQWKNHLITLPSLLHAPQFDNQVLATIHQAILQGQAIEFDYLGKWQADSEHKRLYPIGLVFIDNMVYLTGFYAIGDSLTLNDSDYLKQHRNFAVNRMSHAKILEEVIPETVKKFSLEYLQKLGKLEPHIDKPKQIQLKLKINRYAVHHLTERPLSDDQVITPLDNKSVILKATVENTIRLEDWLIGMSHTAEVLEPQELRVIIIERLQKGLSYYEPSN